MQHVQTSQETPLTKRFWKLTASAGAVAFAASTLLGSVGASALWSDHMGSGEQLTVTDGVMMAQVDEFKSEGEGVMVNGERYFPAARAQIKGEGVQKDGIGKWEVTLKPYNVANAKAETYMDVAVQVAEKAPDGKKNPWRSASFNLGNCDQTPGYFADLDSNGVAVVGDFSTTGGQAIDTCLWGKLPPEAQGIYETEGDGGESVTVGEEAPTGSENTKGTHYKNVVTVTGVSTVTDEKVTDTDDWNATIQRFPNPKNGEVSLLFRPVSTSGMCKLAPAEYY